MMCSSPIDGAMSDTNLLTASTQTTAGRLEPYDGKLSRTVLRGRGHRKVPELPDQDCPTTKFKHYSNYFKWSTIEMEMYRKGNRNPPCG